MDNFIKYFQSVGFADDEAPKIASAFKPVELNKGDFFVKAEKVSKSLAFLESGQLQYYSLDTNGEERTTYISLPNTFVASLLSFLNEIPARENIRALTHSKIWTISKDDLTQLKNEVPSFKDFYIGILEWQICCIDKGKFDLITLTAEQRYEKLLKEEPALLQQVPLQYIASMLGMTPRHLSRLRAKV
ncbi:putative transcriptional regulator, Crp/Fnr family [Haliscomenobacter hydrossis DSM 1100]|uniref:Transcriptional regulator, Crp/Fnr family n=2 Tax=Haliscomenobacter TaxID=2349 RepID=F4L174_HALH1|nr:putative transcriptional regulator, Crp/Fnr family [Haliscomenobacter hydrossis DSM 1100]